MSPTDWALLEKATAAFDPPFDVVDAAAFDANAADLVRRAGGRPIRVASKSVRSRALLRRALARPGFSEMLTYTLAEALWLATDFDDIVGYPTADRSALRALAADPVAIDGVTLMVDSVDHLEFIDVTLGGRSVAPS